MGRLHLLLCCLLGLVWSCSELPNADNDTPLIIDTLLTDTHVVTDTSGETVVPDTAVAD